MNSADQSDYSSDPNDVAVLSAYDQECLMRAIEFALPIRNRGQLFVWAQAYLQSLIAHDLLLCGCGDCKKPDFNMLKVSARVYDGRQLAELTDHRTGLTARAIEAWLRGGEEPLAIYPGKSSARQYDPFRPALERCNLDNFVIHGSRNVDGSTGTYFILAGVQHAFGARHAYLLQLITPHMRKALERILGSEQRFHATDTRLREPKKILTEREVSILQCVQEGKNNREIGIELTISPLTVKNHVQNILKKMKAQNRAQAVSRALSLKLLK